MDFKIKLKTKNDNDLKDKKVITIVFSLKLRKSLFLDKLVGYYSFKITCDKECKDNFKIYKLKDDSEIKGMGDLTLKVIANLLVFISKFVKENHLNPDFIMLLSSDISSKEVMYNDIESIFLNKKVSKKRLEKPSKKEGFDCIQKVVDDFKNTKFMLIDNSTNPKYVKSYEIWSRLNNFMNKTLYDK